MVGKLTIGTILNIFKKVILWALVIFLLAITAFILLLQTSLFQNYITQQSLDLINAQSNQKTTIGHIEIGWFDLIKIDSLEIRDYNQNVMIRADRLTVDFDLFDLVSENKINLDQIQLDQAELNLIKYDDSLSINLVEFIQSLKSLKPKNRLMEAGKSGTLALDQIIINDLRFSYQNQRSDSLEAGKFDYAHFAFNIPESRMSAFSLIADTIVVKIHTFSGVDENSGFSIEKMATNFELSNHRILLDEIDIYLSKSHIKNEIELSYSGLNDFSTFVDSVTMNFQLENSYVHPIDIGYFAHVEEIVPFTFSGNVSGKVGGLSIRNMNMQLTKSSFISGDVDFFGLPNIKETFISLNLKNGQLRPKDFISIIPDLPENILDLGLLKISGQFSGFTSDFVAKAKFVTNNGSMTSDLNLKFPSGWETAEYSGNLKLTNFNAGSFLNNRELFQHINFSGFIKGDGLTIDNANFYTEAKLTNSGIYGYEYKLLKAKGRFASRYFDGELTIDDPNAQLKLRGSMDFKSKPEKLNIQSEIKKIDFGALGITNETFILNTKFDFDLVGLNIDSLNSHAHFTDLGIFFRGKNLQVDTVQLSTENVGTNRTIRFDIPDINGKIEGNFFYTQVIRDVSIIANELISNFQMDSAAGFVFDKSDFEPYKLDFKLNYGNVSRYLDFLNQDIFISNNGLIEGNYYQRKNAMLSVFASIDSINYKGIGFTNNTIDLNIIKDLDSIGIIAIANLSSEKQDWPKVASTSNLNLEAFWEDQKLNLNINVDQPETNSQVSINSVLEFFDSKLIFRFLPSNIKLLGDRWFFDSKNISVYDGHELTISNLDFNQNEQKILVSGVYSDLSNTQLDVVFDNFKLSNLNTAAPINLAGTLNGNFQAEKENANQNFHFLSDLNILELYVDSYLVGDLEGTSKWDTELNRLMIDFDIMRESINTIDLRGYYYPEDPTNNFDMVLNFEKADLKLLSPLFENFISNLEGFADGRIAISGKTNFPLLNGQSQISSGKFTYDYLGVTYLANGSVNFDNEAIKFNEITLTDKDLNEAIVKGKLYHDGFRNIRPEINISTRKFQFLNTTASSDELYYGSAYASGKVDILGSTNDLIINAKVKSEKGTKIFIPLQDGNTIEQKDYITFVNFSDSTSNFNLEEVVKKSITGVKLNFDMELTSDAYIELIFDLRAGDIIRGSAEGNLNLLLDTNGEFELFGEVAITEGAYNFTSSIMGRTFLSKEFKIQPGGTITWYGDPYKGVLNLDAVYRQLASLSDFRISTAQETQISKIPILVVLALSGEMLSPNINFEIEIEDSQSLASQDDLADIKSINDDEQELKRQVFSLLILRNFSKQNSGITVGSADFSSISEFLTNQLSYYASQFNENLEVDLDLASLDQNLFNTLQLRLSYTFLDGRLRVTGGGGFNQTTSSLDNTGESNNFVGDWTVRYLLTSDGRLRIKAFSQTDQVAGNLQRETGVSLQLIKSFDDFKELVPKAREKAIKEKERKSQLADPIN
ncbi:MAG: hypothetical protein ACJA08_000948 [Cyclobacteriaceae bacterium]